MRHPPWGAPCAGVVLGQAHSILCSSFTIRFVLVTPACLLLFSDAQHPCRALSFSGYSLVLYFFPYIYNEMATPRAEVLEQSLQNSSPDDISYVFVNSGCNKILQTEWQKQQKCVPCFSGSWTFQIKPCIGGPRKTVVLACGLPPSPDSCDLSFDWAFWIPPVRSSFPISWGLWPHLWPHLTLIA